MGQYGTGVDVVYETLLDLGPELRETNTDMFLIYLIRNTCYAIWYVISLEVVWYWK